MLSYQHIYHAGNFSDVHKHAVLIRVLTLMKARHPRLWVMDTHAGRGLYDLDAPEALKTEEYGNGIGALWDKNPKGLEAYIEAVRAHNPSGTLRFYPGSARLAADILRASDRMTFAELHPGENGHLQSIFSGVKNVQTAQRDGFTVFLDSLPPPEKYGLAVIDPSYEIKTEYADLPRKLEKARKKWPLGVFFLWYPILRDEPHARMLTALRKTELRDVLVSEVRLAEMPEEGFAMQGAGVALFGSPLREDALRSLTDDIAAALPGEAKGRVYWLDNCSIDPETGLLAL